MSVIVKGAARVDSAGKVLQLGAKAAPDEVVSEDDAKDTAKLAKILTRILSTLATLRRTWVPRSITFEDIACGAGAASISLQHNFGGRVRYWVVDWSAASAFVLQKDATNTTDSTLVLRSFVTGTATIRVEESG